MTSTSRHASFSVRIKGNQLVVTQTLDGARCVFCTLHIDDPVSFFLRDGKVVYLGKYGKEFTFDTLNGEDAQDLLNQLADVQLNRAPDELADACSRHADELEDARSQHAYELAEAKSRHTDQLVAAKSREISQGSGHSGVYWAVVAGVSAVLGFGLAWFLFHGPLESTLTGPPTVSPALTQPAPQTHQEVVLSPARPKPNPTPPPAPSVAPDDGWALPEAIRATLPDKLHNAAERKLFTVDYSSGHARTLYVFADPACPNCKRLEPALNALSDAFNVVVFPVTVIGKEKSIAAITPVLCLPPEQRKAAWDALFDPAPDGLDLGKLSKQQEQPEKRASEGVDSKASQPRDCEIAVKALGINQVAYQAYRIPGTPWVISDDGRYVSQALLRDPLKLQAFLDQGVTDESQ